MAYIPRPFIDTHNLYNKKRLSQHLRGSINTTHSIKIKTITSQKNNRIKMPTESEITKKKMRTCIKQVIEEREPDKLGGIKKPDQQRIYYIPPAEIAATLTINHDIDTTTQSIKDHGYTQKGYFEKKFKSITWTKQGTKVIADQYLKELDEKFVDG
jgi:hypothetical protein